MEWNFTISSPVLWPFYATLYLQRRRLTCRDSFAVSIVDFRTVTPLNKPNNPEARKAAEKENDCWGLWQDLQHHACLRRGPLEFKFKEGLKKFVEHHDEPTSECPDRAPEAGGQLFPQILLVPLKKKSFVSSQVKITIPQ